MVTVWRLTAPEFATKLDGKGNLAHGAPWNSPGRGVVYTSLNLSLAVLEWLVQLPAAMRRRLPELTAVRIEVPDDAPRAEIAHGELSGHDGANVPAARCRELGDAWLTAGENLLLIVPSVIVPQERNALINPVHSLMGRVTIVSTELLRFDPRLATRPR
jgi:RES domain-containing protein